MIASPRLALNLALAILFGLAIAGCANRVDENLCPVDQPALRTTVLLLDTSDPLSPKHAEELRRLVSEFQEPGLSKDFYVAPGDALIVYELSADLGTVEPILKICNPGDHPDSWTWKQSLTEGRQIKLRQWRRFRETIEGMFTQVGSSEAQLSSPIIETLGVLVPRHVPSSRVTGTEAQLGTHFIIFSDLLQHSNALSQYGEYPPAKEVRDTPGLRHLRTDLTGVRMSLFRLERPRDARWQTRDHYYWWTDLIHSFGGQVVSQESI